MIHHGDCLEVMAGMPESSVDAIVTDPPYGISFMSKGWDHGMPGEPFWVQALRVAKPGAYLLAFGGTRTYHRLAVAIEDAGWIIRDCLVWAYAQGFPKSRALLKPAWEPIVMARKPGPLRELAIDECRIGVDGGTERATNPQHLGRADMADFTRGNFGVKDIGSGRWPANVILTDPIFDGDVEGVVGGGDTASGLMRAGTLEGHESYGGYPGREMARDTYGDSGTYSRFFLIPKSARSEREPLIGAPKTQPGHLTLHSQPTGAPPPPPRTNVHPTVKPLDLMRHLVRLVTPPNGTILDPFLGSGTTAIAAEMEGFAWIGIEREAEYVAIAEARLLGVQKGLGLSA